MIDMAPSSTSACFDVQVTSLVDTVACMTAEERVQFSWTVDKFKEKVGRHAGFKEEKKIIPLSNDVPSKWMFYFKQDADDSGLIDINAKLLESAVDKCRVTFEVDMVQGDGKVVPVQKTVTEISPNDEVKIVSDIVRGRRWLQFINATGQFVNVIRFVIHRPMANSKIILDNVDKFLKESADKLQDDLGLLIGQPEMGMIALVSKSGKEMVVSKTILAARCPSLKSLFDCTTDHRIVLDVSDTSLEILARYWYTGRLSEDWCRPEIIHELGFASRMYGIQPILTLLDNILGDDLLVPSSMKLLNMAKKLELESARKKLTESIKARVAMARTEEDLFQVFGNE